MSRVRTQSVSTFKVLANQPVAFDLFSSSFRSGDHCGDREDVDDTLTGEEGDDVVLGKRGEDTIDGGAGADEIYGGKSGMGTDCIDWGWEDAWTCDGYDPFDDTLAFG